jgi:type I restriction enzyme R subunit
MGKAKSEAEIENLYIERLKEMGYEYVCLKNYNDVLENFRTQFCKLNAKKLIEEKGEAALSDSEFQRVLLRLENHTIYESAKILREHFILELDNGKKVYTEFLTDDETRNLYQVLNQITMDPAHHKDVKRENRYDVTILINGLPLVQTELKKPSIDINEAVNQINRYRRTSFVGIFKYIQIFIISNSSEAISNKCPSPFAQELII